MPVQLTMVQGVMTALLLREDGKTQRIVISPIDVLGKDLDRLLKPFLADISLKRDETAKTALFCLRQLGEALLHSQCTAFPTSHEGWQHLILNVHEFIHTRTDRRQTLATRHLSVWGTIRRYFAMLVDEGVIPLSVHLPPVLETLIADHDPRQLLGDHDRVGVVSDSMFDKLLLPISLARTDAEYLDEVREGLIARRDALLNCLTDYWRRLHANLQFGKELRTSLTEVQIAQIVTQHNNRKLKPNPTTSYSQLAIFLIVLERVYDGSAFRYRGKTAERRDIANLKDLPRIRDWPIAQQLPPNFSHVPRKTENYLIWWWLGRLSNLDVAMIVALLTMLHPRWTPVALIEATVTNREGKSYLDLAGDKVIFEVEKHRAKAMKQEFLCPLSEEILSTVIEYSKTVRSRIPQDQALSRRVFLPYGRPTAPGTISVSHPIPSLVSAVLTGRTIDKGSTWLGTLYPDLEVNGLGPGSVSLRKIRATEGVLEWFKTKNLRAAAKRIGNTERVVLEHYIPSALLQAWHTRAVRRFQNLWITVAAANEPFLLDVTDFATLGDLNAFISDSLRLHNPSSSPLAAELHIRLGTRKDAVTPRASHGHLHVSLSSVSLSALYRYQAAAALRPIPSIVLSKIDEVTGVAPEAFLQLADLLKHQLPKDRNPEYRRLHAEALTSIPDAAGLESWATLFGRSIHASKAAVKSH